MMDDYDVCEWHPDRVASGRVRTLPPDGTVQWVPACQACADEFDPQDWKPLR